MELRRYTEEVAALRRKLTLDGKLKEDYLFEELDMDGNAKKTKLSELFQPGKDSHIIYSLMFSNANEKPCTSYTSIADGLNGVILAKTKGKPMAHIKCFS